jgi:EpsI family protein
MGLLLLLGATVLLYHSSLAWLVYFWLDNKDYSHGFLVLPVSVYLVWIKREHLAHLDPRPSPLAGSVMLLASGLLLLAGRAGGLVLAEAVSLLSFLPGIVLFVWGWGYLKTLALPLAYLQFMVPWMIEFIDRVHWPFQLLSANLGVWLLQGLGFAALQEGIFIMLPRITLEVAQECSGVRFLTSIIAIGIPLVYLTQRTWWMGVGVIASGVIITILTNGLRVALVGMSAYYYGSAMVHGPAKMFQGWFVAQVGFIALFLVNWAVCKLPSRSEGRLHERWKTFQGERLRTSEERVSTRPVALLLCFLLALGAYIHLFATPRPVPLRQALAQVPYGIGEWSGADSAWVKGEQFFPGADSDLVRTYRAPSGREVHLYMGYFESQRQGKSLINYLSNPLREGVRVVPLGLPGTGPKWVNQAFLTIDRTRFTALSWYRLPSGETTGRYETKFKAITNAMFQWRNNGAVILLATPLGEKGEEAPASTHLMAFARVIAPTLREFLP